MQSLFIAKRVLKQPENTPNVLQAKKLNKITKDQTDKNWDGLFLFTCLYWAILFVFYIACIEEQTMEYYGAKPFAVAAGIYLFVTTVVIIVKRRDSIFRTRNKEKTSR